MPARWQNAPSLQAQVDELYRRVRAQSAMGLLVPGPGGTWITTSQDAQAKADAAQLASTGYTNDTINAQNLPQMRAEIADAGRRLTDEESNSARFNAELADAGSRLTTTESVASGAATAASNAQATATGASTAAGNAATAAANAWDRAGDAYTYAVALKGRMDNFATALNALRNYVNAQHPGAPSWPGGL